VSIEEAKAPSVAVVTDTAASYSPAEAAAYGISVVPLELKFIENGRVTPCSEADISPDEFYRRMRASDSLPQTSGAVTGRITKMYLELAKRTSSIISIHITSKHSVAWESAVLGAQIAQEERPDLRIEVIDSKQITLGTWFPAELAAQMAQQGAQLEEIKQAVLTAVSKTRLLIVLASLENVVKGGRLPRLSGYLGTLLDIKPIIELVDGEVRDVAKVRTHARAVKEMVRRVAEEQAQRGIVKMAVAHTNDPAIAERVRAALAEFFPGDIPIHEAGAVLGVHAGEGAVGVVFQYV
jgi:DegV family protein with EDD domain